MAKTYMHTLSGATVFFFLAHALTIIAAFLTAYYTHGLWIKEATYREQPRVSYAHTCAVKLQVSMGGSACLRACASTRTCHA